MGLVHSLRRFRPTNVATRLGPDHCACVLNPRDVQRALASEARGVVAFEVALVPPLLSGILRAARASDAVIGLTAAVHPLHEGASPESLFRHVAEALAEAEHRLPVFLRAGPVVLRPSDADGLGRSREAIFRVVDAGFTAVAVDVCGLGIGEGATLLAEVTQPVRERELSVELVSAEATARGLSEQLVSVRARGVSPDVIIPAGSAIERIRSVDALVQACSPAVLAAREPADPARAVQHGIRRLHVGRPFMQIVESSLPASLRENLAGWGTGGFSDTGRAWGFIEEEIAGLDEAARLRVEAHAYHETMDLLARAGAVGTAGLVAHFLQTQSGY